MSDATKTFCPLPWASVALRNDGSYRICCQANVSEKRGLLTASDGRSLNAATDSLETARNSPELMRVRKNMLSGQWDSACQRCQSEESSGLRSRRIYSMAQIENSFDLEVAKKLTKHDGSIVTQQIPIRDLDLRFGNTCNLKCRMCGPQDSSSWVSEHQLLFPKTKIHLSNMNWYDKDDFWNELEPSLGSIKHIYIVGGEPLLIQKHFQFLQRLSDLGVSKNISLEYNTNLTILPKDGLEVWNSFRSVSFGVSIDGFGSVNDYIRYPSQFEVIAKNLKILKQNPKFNVWISATISTYSILSYIDLAKWAYEILGTDLRTKPKSIVKSHALHQPLPLNLQSLPQSSKQYVEFEMKNQLQHLKTSAAPVQLVEFLEISVHKYLDFMKRKNIPDQLGDFFDYTEKLDQHRNQSFSKLYPQLYSELRRSFQEQAP